MVPAFADDSLMAGPSQEVLRKLRHIKPIMPKGRVRKLAVDATMRQAAAKKAAAEARAQAWVYFEASDVCKHGFAPFKHVGFWVLLANSSIAFLLFGSTPSSLATELATMPKRCLNLNMKQKTTPSCRT